MIAVIIECDQCRKNVNVSVEQPRSFEENCYGEAAFYLRRIPIPKGWIVDGRESHMCPDCQNKGYKNG